MPTVAQLIGGAGTGKTAELLRVLDKVIETGLVVDPLAVGFVSFTRAARREASSRAADRFGDRPEALERRGWFRTLHAVCHKQLGVGKELIAPDKEGREWLRDAFQEDVNVAGRLNETDYGEPFGGEDGDADRALRLWQTARNRLEPLGEAQRRAADCDERTPSLEYCRRIVDMYETSKRLDHRLDFTDMLARFAGWYLSPDGPERCEPDGEVPRLKVWFLDEVQDSSPLLHAVERRLISTDECQWAYIAGDPFQSIFQWAGADPKCFLNWPHAKQRIMPRSYRCPNEILALGERVLSECSDYWDRGIAPADHEGAVETASFGDPWIEDVDPRQEWLLLARTNQHVRRLTDMLDERDVPWLSTKGGGKWHAPVRGAVCNALTTLEKGGPIDGGEWRQILDHVHSKHNGDVLLVRGTKKRFKEHPDPQDAFPWVMVGDLEQLGATPAMIAAVRAGLWRTWVKGAEDREAAVQRWGQEAVDDPKIRVSTVHGAKGLEADNVALLTTTSLPCSRSAETQEGFDEEARVAYVGVTRARRRLVLINEPGTRHKWQLT